MSRSVTCYPIPGKRKALLLCEAFAAGVRASGGDAHVCTEPPRELAPGAAVFYGVRPPVAHLWEQAKREGRDWYYIDNSYFDVARERQFRVTKNAIQHRGLGASDGRRLAALGVQVKPMRDQVGNYVLVCAQSDEFMDVVAEDRGWLLRTLKEYEQRGPAAPAIMVRMKDAKVPLIQDLQRSAMVLTWSSAAAVGALLEGVPALGGPQSCVQGLTHYGDRRRWASVLADNQWTIAEISRGDAWKALNA